MAAMAAATFGTQFSDALVFLSMLSFLCTNFSWMARKQLLSASRACKAVESGDHSEHLVQVKKFSARVLLKIAVEIVGYWLICRSRHPMGGAVVAMLGHSAFIASTTYTIREDGKISPFPGAIQKVILLADLLLTATAAGAWVFAGRAAVISAVCFSGLALLLFMQEAKKFFS